MAKGDSVRVRSEIGGQLQIDDIRVTGAGGEIEVDWGDRGKGMVHVLLKGRTGKVKEKHTFALIAVRSMTETKKDVEWSESEVQWVRVRNNVGQLTKYSAWHVIIPGLGSLDIPPGTWCGVSLSGSRQFAPHSGLRELDGGKHDVCLAAATDWIAGLDPSAPALPPDEPEKVYAPPG